MDIQQDLITIIRARCVADKLPGDHPLISACCALEEAIENNHVPRIVGRWVKLRRLWCEYSGEPMI